MSIIKHVTLQKIVAHDFRYDPRKNISRSQWPCGLRRESEAARLQGLRVRIPPGAWMFVSCKCYVLPGRDLCDGPIPRPELSYRCVCVCVRVCVYVCAYDVETSIVR